MEDLLSSKGIYIITLGTETALDEDEKKAKWENKNDQAHHLIGMSILPDLRFHLDGEDSPVKSWEKLNSIFGIKMRFRPFNLRMSYLS